MAARLRLQLLVGAALAVAATPAVAQTPGAPACAGTGDSAACLPEAEAPRHLQQLLAELGASLAVPERALLASSQRRWETFTASQCRLSAASVPVEGKVFATDLCRRGAVVERIRQLAPLLCRWDERGTKPCAAAAAYLERYPLRPE